MSEKYKFELPFLRETDAPLKKGAWGSTPQPVFELVWPDLAPSWVNIPDVIDVKFVMPYDIKRTAEIVLSMAMGAYMHPGWRHYNDTMQGDRLFEGLVAAPVQAYFAFIADYIDPSTHDGGFRFNWQYLAGIAFWTGRTGGGVVEKLAGCDRKFYHRCPPSPNSIAVSWGAHLGVTEPNLAVRRWTSMPDHRAEQLFDEHAVVARIKAAQSNHRYLYLPNEEGEREWKAVHINDAPSDEMWARMLREPVPIWSDHTTSPPRGPFFMVGGQFFEILEDGAPGEGVAGDFTED